MGFDSYKGSIKLGAGLTPSGEGFPLAQTSDIQADESGKRLDVLLSELAASGGTGVDLSDEIAEQQELVGEIKLALQNKAAAGDNNTASTWIFNDEISVTELYRGYDIKFWFTRGDTSVECVRVEAETIGAGVPALRFRTATSSYIVYHGANNYGVAQGWIDESYKKIILEEEPTDETINAWLKANAVKQRTEVQRKVDTRLKTAHKTIVEAINELHDKIPEEYIQGTWLFNETITNYATDEEKAVSCNFKSYDPYNYGNTYSVFAFSVGDSPKLSYRRGGPQPDVYNFNTNTWYNEQYRTIEITEEIDDSDFIVWLKTNAVKQPIEYQLKNDDTLETVNKTVVGAINEINAKTREDDMNGTWLFNDTLDLTTLPSISLPFVSNASNYTQIVRGTVGSSSWGIYEMRYYVSEADTDRAYTHNPEGSYGITHGWTNEAYKTIQIYGYDNTNTDFNVWLRANATRTQSGYQRGYDENLETTEKNVVGAINEVNAKTVDKISHITFPSGGVSSVYPADDGIGWQEDEVELETQKSDGSVDYHYFASINRVPIVAGDNVTFTVDEENQVVKINATGGGSGVSFPLPRIRFANFKKVEDEETGDITYRFTIENLGGGTLQVGDQLQICCRRSYPDGKQKLRGMTSHYITEEDLNYRFLKIEVDPSTEDVQKWLFRNDHAKGYKTMSPMYFRLKRATAWNDSGEECNAIFSNVEQVWKTYNYNKSLYGGADIKSLNIK